MSDVITGSEALFYEWNGSDHTEYNAIVTNIISGDPSRPNVTLRYSDGAVGRQATNIPHIEAFPTVGDLAANDYWRPNRVAPIFVPPKQNSVPAQGQVVWVNRWDATLGEHIWRLGFIRAVQGIPAVDSRINVTVYDPASGDAINVNGVDSWQDYVAVPSNADGNDYWVDRLLAPGDD